MNRVFLKVFFIIPPLAAQAANRTWNTASARCKNAALREGSFAGLSVSAGIGRWMLRATHNRQPTSNFCRSSRRG